MQKADQVYGEMDGHAANLRMAIAHSCNSYFSNIYRLAVDNPAYKNVDEGYAHWKKYMNSFGFGVRLGVDLPSEDDGLIVDTSFYNKLYNNSWNSCTNVFLGIGQGEMQATPLQMANMMCIIANKGYYYTPHFVDSIDGKGEGDTILNPFRVKHEVTHIPDSIYEIVQLGMQDVVENGTGTGSQDSGYCHCRENRNCRKLWYNQRKAGKTGGPFLVRLFRAAGKSQDSRCRNC